MGVRKEKGQWWVGIFIGEQMQVEGEGKGEQECGVGGLDEGVKGEHV